MALNGFLDIELSVKNPDELGSFWERHGFIRTSDGVYGTVDRPTVMTIKEGDHRHLSAMHFSCAAERDITDVAKRLGVSPRTYAGYVADLKAEYEAETRFQLGYQMGRLGLTGHENDDADPGEGVGVD